MDPATMMLIAQGAVKAGQAGSRLLQPRFQNTEFGRLLRRRREQGNLTPGQESVALGRTATTATKQANLANRRYMGSLINRGLQGSVSAQRGLREAEADVRRTVADTGRRIFESEEQAKSKARENYARAMDRDKAERRQAGLGVLSAGIETAGNIYGQRASTAQADQAKKDQSYMDAVEKFGASNIEQVFSPDTGKSLGFIGKGLTNADKRAIESFKQKNDVPNRGKVMEFLTNSKDNTELDARLSYARLLYPELFSGE